MLVKEMHVSLDINLQMIASNRKIIVKPEEKDYFLTEAMHIYIKRKVDKTDNPRNLGFEDTQLIYDGLSDIKRTEFIDTYRSTQEADLVYSILPYDYLHKVNSSSKIYFNCSDIAFNNDTVTNTVWSLPLKTDKTSKPYYGNFIIKLANNTIFTMSEYSIPSLNSVQAKFILVNAVLEHFNIDNEVGLRVYWEKYDNLYIRDQFIFVSQTLSTDIMSVTHQDTAESIANPQYIVRLSDGISGDMKNDALKSYMSNRLLSSSITIDAKNHSFMKSHYKSPMTYLENGRLNIYHKSNWIPLRLDLNT